MFPRTFSAHLFFVVVVVIPVAAASTPLCCTSKEAEAEEDIFFQLWLCSYRLGQNEMILFEIALHLVDRPFFFYSPPSSIYS
jgi:hypothetical protein